MKNSFYVLMASILLANQAMAAIDGDIVGGEVVLPKTVNSSITVKDGKRISTHELSDYAKQVNESEWSPNMNVNTAMTVKIQTLLDWNHAAPGPIDGGWGANSKKALTNFQKLKGLEVTGKMNQETWDALIAGAPKDQPILVSYTLTAADLKGPYAPLPEDTESRAKLKGLYYESVMEMLGERFHMDIAYVKKINPNKNFVAGETITVINTGKPIDSKISKLVADKAESTLFAYSGNELVATFPAVIGNSQTAAPAGQYTISGKMEMPTYKAVVKTTQGDNKSFVLPAGPNNPVGVAWIGLDTKNKASCGIHGSAIPEVIGRVSTIGCIRLTNWDVMELYPLVSQNTTVEIR